MASRSTQAVARLLKQSAPSSSRTAARAFSSTPSTLFSSSASTSAPSSVPGTRVYAPSPSALTAHLSSILSPLSLDLPEELAQRAMTSKAVASVGGVVREGEAKAAHNEKLVFVGRRALRMHFTLFLHSALSKQQSVMAQYLAQQQVDLLLETRALGAGPGRALALEKAMRWREVRTPSGEPSGLFKSRGQAVEALLGAVYLQHGIAASSKLFHAIVLPHLAFDTTLANALDNGGAQVGVESEVVRTPVAEPVVAQEVSA